MYMYRYNFKNFSILSEFEKKINISPHNYECFTGSLIYGKHQVVVTKQYWKKGLSAWVMGCGIGGLLRPFLMKSCPITDWLMNHLELICSGINSGRGLVGPRYLPIYRVLDSGVILWGETLCVIFSLVLFVSFSSSLWFLELTLISENSIPSCCRIFFSLSTCLKDTGWMNWSHICFDGHEISFCIYLEMTEMFY